MKLFLDEKLVTGSLLTPDGVLAYVALRKIMDENTFMKSLEITEDCVSMNRLAYTLVGASEKYPKVFTDALQRGIYELNAVDKIKILQSFGKEIEFVLDVKNLYFDTSKDGQYFVMVFAEEVRKILTHEGKTEKNIRMLKYFLALISSLDWSESMKCKPDMPNLQGRIGHMTQNYVSSLAQISDKTCQRYNLILDDEMHLIYIYRSNDKIRESDSLKQITNCYSRYSDKALCEMYASDFESKMGHKHRIMRTRKNKEQADNNRRLAQIYNRICDGHGAEYDKDTIRAVFKYITNKNKTIIDEIDNKQSQKYMTYADKEYVEKLQSQIRDTFVFEQFGYLYNEELQDESDADEYIWGETDAMNA